MHSSHLSKFDQPAAGFLAILWLSNEDSSRRETCRHTHVKHSDATQIAKEILKEAAKPRQSASVKEAFEKKNACLYRPENAW